MHKRPVMNPRLDRAAVTSGTARDTAQCAFRAVIWGLDRNRSTAEQVRALPRHWRAVYTTYWLQCEVENGGHHQFFWNMEGALNAETQEDLDLIGALSAAALFADARRVFEAHDYPAEKAGAGQSWEAFTEGYRQKRMDALDEAFYRLPKRPIELLGEFIRANADLFVVRA
jgi:hypothetical protein